MSISANYLIILEEDEIDTLQKYQYLNMLISMLIICYLKA
jgi:hypothetical protein